jgi:hypothetical protein
MKTTNIAAGLLLGLLLPLAAWAQAGGLPMVTSTPGLDGSQTYTLSIQTLLTLTALTFIPAALLMMTSFTRIIIVLSLLRHALGTQTSPPNQVLLGLALFLTFFIMSPVLDRVYSEAYLPLSEDRITFLRGVERGAVPLRSSCSNRPANPTSRCSPAWPGRRPFVDRRHPDAPADPGFRHQRVEDRFSDRLHHLHPLPDRRHGRRQRADVDGHDDDVAGDGGAAVQADALRARRWLASCCSARWSRASHMTPEMVMDIGRQAVEMTLLLSAPLLLAALVIGLIVSIFQAATQINEQTLSFIPSWSACSWSFWPAPGCCS